jgi:hypothetical protein
MPGGILMIRNQSKTLSTVVAVAIVFGAMQPLAAAAATIAASDGPIACHDFERGVNGTWTVLRAAIIGPVGGPSGRTISLSPGQSFAKNQWVDGVEVTTVLDRNCGNE